MTEKKKSKPVKAPMHGIAELNGCVCSLASVGMQADKCTKTTKAIAEYVGREHGQEMRMLVLKGTDGSPEEPQYPEGDGVTDKDKAIWSKEYDVYVKQRQKYKEQRAKMFTIVLGQCEKAMRHRVESSNQCASMESSSNVVSLMRIIKDEAYDANDRKYPQLQAALAWKELSKAWQSDGEDLMDFCRRFTGLVDKVERAHGPVAPIVIAKKNEDYESDKGTVLNMERGKVLACLFMEGVNKKDYGGMLKKLADDYALGAAKCPETVEAALQVLAVCNEKALRKRQGGNAQSETNPTSEMSMAQNGRGPQCWKCGKNGHLKRDCPEVQQSGQTHAQNQLPSWMV